MTKKQYLLFDHDGVLVDTEQWYYQANKRALAEIDVELPLNVYLKIMAAGQTCWRCAEQEGISQSIIDRQRQRRNQYYQQYLQQEDIEIAGVSELLRELSRDYHLAIVTTARRVDFELIHQHRDITPYMDFVLTNEDYARSKPQPDPYLAALARYQCSAQQALVIEDSQRGLTAAVNAGIECVVVFNEFTQSHDLSAADFRLSRLTDLPELLTTIN